jgi:hypothetical protein
VWGEPGHFAQLLHEMLPVLAAACITVGIQHCAGVPAQGEHMILWK